MKKLTPKARQLGDDIPNEWIDNLLKNKKLMDSLRLQPTTAKFTAELRALLLEVTELHRKDIFKKYGIGEKGC